MLPRGVLTDSYKASHYLLYPPAIERYAYGEFRSSFDKDELDHRILFYGLKYIVDTHIAKRWTTTDVTSSAEFFNHHNAGSKEYPFPKSLFEKIVNEHEGWFPVKIEGLAEGSVIYPHVPVYTITAENEFSALVTWLETLLTMVWYPTTVATLSRRIRDQIQIAFDRSVESEFHHLIETRLHDFGFRGCTSVEQALIGGTAHLLNFRGTDTAVAAYHVQYHLNEGRPVGESIPATEHSVMTAHPTEREAMLRVIEEFGDGVFACVMDSYDYIHALTEILPSIAQHKLDRGGFMILRPDSGDPLECVIAALEALERVFGAHTNSLGFKVLKGCGVIQGDGINSVQVSRLLTGIMEVGYSAQNVAFGMGANLLHKVNRDTMSFATKLSFTRDLQDIPHDICKMPRTDSSKASLPGRFSVQADEKGLPTVYPLEDKPNGEEQLKVYYDHGPVKGAHLQRTFDEIRGSAKDHWESLPKIHQPLSVAVSAKMKSFHLKLMADRP
jgi:nicotinamide phosphoribosyltransferase